jgi:hypothetical protein
LEEFLFGTIADSAGTDTEGHSIAPVSTLIRTTTGDLCFKATNHTAGSTVELVACSTKDALQLFTLSLPKANPSTSEDGDTEHKPPAPTPPPTSSFVLSSTKTTHSAGLCIDIEPPFCNRITGLDFSQYSTPSISGTIPPAIGGFSQLRSLRFPQTGPSGLRGILPASALCKTKLDTLELPAGKVGGTLPSCFGKISASGWSTLILSNNNFGGALPASLGANSNLHMLKAHSAGFTGALNTSVCELPWDKGNPALWQQCDLAGNNFKCPLPGCLPINCNAICH